MDKAMAAEMMSLPSASFVGELMPEINIGLLQKARNMVRKEIASQLKPELIRLYGVNNNTSDYVFTPAEVGRRAVQNACLSYLLELPTTEGVGLAVHQFNNSHGSNMTDSYSALAGLVNCDVAVTEKGTVLDAFYETWKNDTDVLDKWLSVQASAQTPNTLDVVKTLLKHPAYNQTKPNKVRSVIGGFCMSGAENFHNLDGSGYDFVADFIIGYDKLNPQVAARLVGVLLRWKRMDSVRASLMKNALEKIQNSGKLSPNVSEIVEKGLA
jgi:aminopeptidase N